MIEFNGQYYKPVILFIFVFLSSGCASINYYSQSIQGQFEVMHKSRSIDDVLEDKNTSHTLRNRLHTILKIRAFSVEKLGLPDNKSYLSFADLGRDYVVWNIFAAEEFSLEPQQWCFLFVGCLQYRGYFSKQNAINFADELKSKGMETYLGGVSAYSTLGWFNDPVLNTMLKWSDARLAAVIFHELTHQLIYIKGDTEFNESLADAVAIIGVRQWLSTSGQTEQLEAYENYLARENAFVNLILKYKPLLEDIYRRDTPNDFKRREKQRLFNSIKSEYEDIKTDWDKDYYGNWIRLKLNNASMASVISYRKYLNSFMKLYESTNNDIENFYKKVNLLAKCTFSERQRLLTQGITHIHCQN